MEKTKKGDILKLFRLLNGLAQDDLAALLSIHQRNVAMIESGRFLLRSDLIKSMTYAFELSPTYYHYGTLPIFSSDIVFFATSGQLLSKDIVSISTLLSDFMVKNKIDRIFIVNRAVLVLPVYGQLLFIYSEASAQILETAKMSPETVKLNISISEQDIERIYNFPFATVNVAQFIEAFLSYIDPESVFNTKDFLSVAEESKDYIIRKIRGNKSAEILEIMQRYDLDLEDVIKYIMHKPRERIFSEDAPDTTDTPRGNPIKELIEDYEADKQSLDEILLPSRLRFKKPR